MPEQPKNPGLKFRHLHKKDTVLLMPNAWDKGSACILEFMNFQAIATTSAGAAYANGLVDGQLRKEQVFANAKDILSATSRPVNADLENGYGDDPRDVYDTITQAGQLGLAGASIEDFTGDPKNPIYDEVLAGERIAAAVEAKSNLPYDFVLTARCEALLHTDQPWEDVVRRLMVYQHMGADVLFAPKLPNLQAIRATVMALDKPLNVLSGIAGYNWSVAELAECGVMRISVGSALARYAYSKCYEAGQEMLQDGTFGFVDKSMNFSGLDDIMASK